MIIGAYSAFTFRYEKLVESEETNYQEQRRRLQQEHLQRMADCEEREKQALSEKDRLVKLAHTEYEDKLQVKIFIKRVAVLFRDFYLTGKVTLCIGCG